MNEMLQWLRLDSQTHELRADGEVVAVLHWKGGFHLQAEGSAQTSEGTWEFNETGLIKKTVVVSSLDLKSELGILRWTAPFVGEGEISFATGPMFRWRKSPAGRGFVDESGQWVFTVTSTGEVPLGPQAQSIPELKILLCLGRFLLLILDRNTAL